MRLSEALILGMSVYHFDPERWICANGGCLLGVAARAAGVHFPMTSNEDIELISARWPWIDQIFWVPEFAKSLPELDAETAPYAQTGNHLQDSAKAIISFLANHVKLGTVNLEQVVDWVRSVEPAEEVTIETPMETHADAVVHQVR